MATREEIDSYQAQIRAKEEEIEKLAESLPEVQRAKPKTTQGLDQRSARAKYSRDRNIRRKKASELSRKAEEERFNQLSPSEQANRLLAAEKRQLEERIRRLEAKEARAQKKSLQASSRVGLGEIEPSESRRRSIEKKVARRLNKRDQKLASLGKASGGITKKYGYMGGGKVYGQPRKATYKAG
jgi:hypothetical protein